MTSSQLEALLIDQALGELSEEASALVEAYLAAFPDRRAEASRVRDALLLTEQAVVARPLLGRDDADTPVITLPASRAPFFAPLLRAAAAVALLGLALAAGYFAGSGGREDSPREKSVATSESPPASSPWARYRVEENGRLAVILPSDPHS